MGDGETLEALIACSFALLPRQSGVPGRVFWRGASRATPASASSRPDAAKSSRSRGSDCSRALRVSACAAPNQTLVAPSRTSMRTSTGPRWSGERRSEALSCPWRLIQVSCVPSSSVQAALPTGARSSVGARVSTAAAICAALCIGAACAAAAAALGMLSAEGAAAEVGWVLEVPASAPSAKATASVTDLAAGALLSGLESVVSVGSDVASPSSESLAAAVFMKVDAVGAELWAAGCRVGRRMPGGSCHAADAADAVVAGAVVAALTASSSSAVSLGEAALGGLAGLAVPGAAVDVLAVGGVFALAAWLTWAAAAGMTVGGIAADAGTAGAAGAGDAVGAVGAVGAGGTAPTAAALSGCTLGVAALDAGALGGGAAGIATGAGGLCAAARSAVGRTGAPVLPVGAGGASAAEAALSLDLAGPVGGVGVACAPNPLSTARKFVAVTASEESGEPEFAGAALALEAAALLALVVDAVGTFLSAMCCSLG